MFPLSRRYVVGFLSGMLVFSLIGVVSSGASVEAGGKVVSARLTKTSFTAAQAGTVKLVCKFSPASSRFGYLLSWKKGAKWAKVRSVNKKGSFSGSYKMNVKKLFGSKSVKVGQYRVKVSADANSITRKFTVKKAPAPAPAPGVFSKTSPANGATEQLTSAALSWGSSSNAASYEYCIDTTNDNTCAGSWVSAGAVSSVATSGLLPSTTYYWQVRARNVVGETYSDGGAWWSFATWKPKAGAWTTTGKVSFSVSSDQAMIEPFSDTFYPSGCGFYSVTLFAHNTPIANGQFAKTGSFYFSGTFDSSTTAHGSVGLNNYYVSGCYLTGGPFTWTATWSSP
jgi:hypothetical protein